MYLSIPTVRSYQSQWQFVTAIHDEGEGLTLCDLTQCHVTLEVLL